MTTQQLSSLSIGGGRHITWKVFLFSFRLGPPQSGHLSEQPGCLPPLTHTLYLSQGVERRGIGTASSLVLPLSGIPFLVLAFPLPTILPFLKGMLIPISGLPESLSISFFL